MLADFLSVINFICILVIYATLLYMNNMIVGIQDEVNNLIDYYRVNEIQLKNLIKDINFQDRQILLRNTTT